MPGAPQTIPFSKLMGSHEKGRTAVVGSDLPLACLQGEKMSLEAGWRGLSVSQCCSGNKHMKGRAQSPLGSLLESHQSETKDALPFNILQ